MQSDVKSSSTRHPARRQSALLLALAGLRQQQLSPGQLSRVTVDRDGALHIEAEAAGLQRWFRFNDTTLAELRPRDDRRILLLKNRHENNAGAETSLLSYRPGRRVVLGLAGARRHSIVKGYRRRGSEHAANCHEIALAACGEGGFVVPRLLEHSEEDESLVMARQCGSNPGIGSESAGVWVAIGLCLRRFQKAGVTEYLPKFGAADELRVLDEQARRFLLCIPVLPENWQMGRDLLIEAAAKLPPADPCLTHRDLHDGQFLTSGEVVSLLDFDLLCNADSALDPGNLLAHIALRELQSARKAGGASACSRALLFGLSRQDEPGFRQRLLFYQATSFYRLGLLYALRPRWAHLAVALIERGKRCIDRYNVESE
jgi:hypothetical protein